MVSPKPAQDSNDSSRDVNSEKSFEKLLNSCQRLDQDELRLAVAAAAAVRKEAMQRNQAAVAELFFRLEWILLSTRATESGGA